MILPAFRGAKVKESSHYDDAIEIEFSGYNLDLVVSLEDRTITADFANEWRSPQELIEVLEKACAVADWLESLPEDGDEA